jgi:hypothetical protein
MTHRSENEKKSIIPPGVTQKQMEEMVETMKQIAEPFDHLPPHVAYVMRSFRQISVLVHWADRH